MSKRDTYESRTEQLLLPIVEENQFELVDVEYVKEGSNWYLRAYIDKAGGINIDDCELVSRALSDLLDKDFVRNKGKKVEIRCFKMVEGTKEFVGTLTAFDKESVTIETGEKEMVFARKEIALIRPAIDFD